MCNTHTQTFTLLIALYTIGEIQSRWDKDVVDLPSKTSLTLITLKREIISHIEYNHDKISHL